MSQQQEIEMLKSYSAIIHRLPQGEALFKVVESALSFQQSDIEELAKAQGIDPRYVRMLLLGENGRGKRKAAKDRLQQIKEFAAPLEISFSQTKESK